MQSSESEVIKLNSIINTENARGAVEKWLVELEQLMKKSIHRVRWNQSYNTIFWIIEFFETQIFYGW